MLSPASPLDRDRAAAESGTDAALKYVDTTEASAMSWNRWIYGILWSIYNMAFMDLE